MGIHLLVLAKLKILAAGRGPRPFVGLLVWPFIFKLPIHTRISKIYADFTTSSTLFLFRLGQIFFQEPPLARGRRWERALRLFRERLTIVGRISAAQAESNEASFHQMSMLAL